MSEHKKKCCGGSCHTDFKKSAEKPVTPPPRERAKARSAEKEMLRRRLPPEKIRPDLIKNKKAKTPEVTVGGFSFGSFFIS